MGWGSVQNGALWEPHSTWNRTPRINLLFQESLTWSEQMSVASKWESNDFLN